MNKRQTNKHTQKKLQLSTYQILLLTRQLTRCTNTAWYTLKQNYLFRVNSACLLLLLSYRRKRYSLHFLIEISQPEKSLQSFKYKKNTTPLSLTLSCFLTNTKTKQTKELHTTNNTTSRTHSTMGQFSFTIELIFWLRKHSFSSWLKKCVYICLSGKRHQASFKTVFSRMQSCAKLHLVICPF